MPFAPTSLRSHRGGPGSAPGSDRPATRSLTLPTQRHQGHRASSPNRPRRTTRPRTSPPPLAALPGHQIGPGAVQHRILDPSPPPRRQAAAIAADRIAWLQILGLDGDLATAEPKRLRYRVLHTAAELTHRQRHRWLRIPATWSWADEITATFSRIAAIAASG
jgi:hypothetical protein